MERGQEHENQHRHNLLAKFYSRPKNGKETNDNAVDNNPLDIIQRAFQSLREEDQQRIQRGRYGGGDEPIEESTTFVNEKLAELDREIDRLSHNIKKAYVEAIQQEIEYAAAVGVASAAVEKSLMDKQPKIKVEENQDDKRGEDEKKKHFECRKKQPESCGKYHYIRSKSFRLMFLRADNFNARLAARRITRYFKEKKELFGDRNLSTKVKHVDLSKTDKNFLYSGCFGSTGALDSHGRRVAFFCRRLAEDVPVDSIRRAAFYFFQILLEEQEESQKHGLVFVTDGRGMDLPQALSSERRMYPAHRMVISALPLRFACTHVCYDNRAFDVFIRTALMVFPTKLRSVAQLHFGNNPKDIFPPLVDYGIQLEALPLTSEWEVCEETVSEFLMASQQKEEASEEFPHWLTKEIICWL